MSIQDAAAIIGAVTGPIGVILAGAALWAWRFQVRGASRHEAAKRVLSAMHTLDDAVKMARHNLVLFKAIRDGRILGPPPKLDPYVEARRVATPIWNGVKQLQDAEHDAFGPIGPEVKEQLQSVYRIADLFMRQFHFEWGTGAEEAYREHLEMKTKWEVRPDALYDDAKNDEFAGLLEVALNDAESYFRRKL